MATTINRVITNITYTATLINEATDDIKRVSFSVAGDPSKSYLKTLAEQTAKEQGLNGYDVFKVQATETHSAKQYTMNVNTFVNMAKKVNKRSLGRYVSKSIDWTKLELTYYNRNTSSLFKQEVDTLEKVSDFLKGESKTACFANDDSSVILVDYEIKEVVTGLFEMPEQDFMKIAVVTDLSDNDTDDTETEENDG